MDCLVLNAIVIATLHYSCACTKKKKTRAHIQRMFIYSYVTTLKDRQTDRTRGVCGPHTVIYVISVTLTRTICASVFSIITKCAEDARPHMYIRSFVSVLPWREVERAV